MKIKINNLFSGLPGELKNEIFDILAESENVKIERILSCGQKTPDGQWYDQEQNEFVILLSGGAVLQFKENNTIYELLPGDYINIPAGVMHRVDRTDENMITVWLAVHY